MHAGKMRLLCGMLAGFWALTSGCGDTKTTDDEKSGSSTSDASLLANAKTKLMECKVYESKSEDVVVEDEADRCEMRCIAAATCAELKDLRCSENPSLGGSLTTCIFSCPSAPADGYACSNGAKIAHNALCDGEADCGDGADESNCKSFVCKDKETITAADVECDGYEDCSDGSDELNCESVCS